MNADRIKAWHSCLFATVIVLTAATTAAAETAEITLRTQDNLTIKATLTRPEVDGKLPAVVLIHQGGSDRTEWDAVVPMLTEQGYVTLAYDVRGHGQSDPVKSIYILFSDPAQAPLDLEAALAYLRSRDFVNMKKIAIVGSSIGANLACVAAGRAAYRIKTAVAISGKTQAVRDLAGVLPGDDFQMRSVFYISSMESGGQRATWAREMYAQTTGPRQLAIIENSRAHGVSIFKDEPELVGRILQWLQDSL